MTRTTLVLLATLHAASALQALVLGGGFAGLYTAMNLANGGAVWTVPKQMMNLAKVSAPISSCPTPPASGPFPTGTAPCPVLSYTSSGRTLSVSLPTVTPAVKPHDMMTFKASKGHTYVVANSSNMVTNLLTIRAAGWMAIYVK